MVVKQRYVSNGRQIIIKYAFDENKSIVDVSEIDREELLAGKEGFVLPWVEVSNFHYDVIKGYLDKKTTESE